MSAVALALHKLVTEATGMPHLFRHYAESGRHRLIAQKVIYLLSTHFGLPMPNWRFNWYVTGPYSPHLDPHLQEAAALTAKDINRPLDLPAPYREAAAQLRRLLAEGEHCGMELSEWAELLASLVYISRWKNVPVTAAEVAERVCSAKPKYSSDQVRQAIRALVAA